MQGCHAYRTTTSPHHLTTNAYYSDPPQKHNHSKLYMIPEQWAKKWTQSIMLVLGLKPTKSTHVDIAEIEPEDTSALDYFGETKPTDVERPREKF